MNGYELFAAGGGWSTGHRMARPDDHSIGIEFNLAACQTAEAAGHKRIHADIMTVNPAEFNRVHGPFGFAHFSPTCRGFTLTGTGRGRLDGERMIGCIKRMAGTETTPEQVRDLIDEFDLLARDPRSHLTMEALWWIAITRPRYVTMEQVKQVLPIWEATAEVLRSWGYSAATGILHAEQFGLAQTRARAILVADLSGAPVHLPAPTHSRYHGHAPGRLDAGLLPWVSVREALADMDWDMRINNQTEQDWDLETLASRPVTAVGGRSLVAFRGDYRKRSRNDGFVFTVEQLARLQSFPDGYPFQGSKGDQFQQIGDAVPPTMARAVVTSLMGEEGCLL